MCWSGAVPLISFNRSNGTMRCVLWQCQVSGLGLTFTQDRQPHDYKNPHVRAEELELGDDNPKSQNGNEKS